MTKLTLLQVVRARNSFGYAYVGLRAPARLLYTIESLISISVILIS